jgi:hypothetical protein
LFDAVLFQRNGEYDSKSTSKTCHSIHEKGLTVQITISKSGAVAQVSNVFIAPNFAVISCLTVL